MIICREIRINGRVQGVNFRHYTKQEAEKLGITGTVRNCEDGSVLIFAQGEENPMQEFMEWCSTGPSAALVAGIEVGETENRGYKDFRIVR
jgi:acylphosphatase